MSQRRRPARRIELVRGGWGLACVVVPDALLTSVFRTEPSVRATRTIRVLGVRHLVQAVASGLAPTPAVLAVGIWVDALHAATAAAAAALDRRRRAAFGTDAVIAGTFAALCGATQSRRSCPHAPAWPAPWSHSCPPRRDPARAVEPWSPCTAGAPTTPVSRRPDCWRTCATAASSACSPA